MIIIFIPVVSNELNWVNMSSRFSKATQYATVGMLLQKNEPQNLHIYTIINSHMHEDTPKAT